VGRRHIFIVSAGAPADRVRQLVDAVVGHGIDVVADPSAGADTYTEHFAFPAAGIVVAWGHAPPDGNATRLAGHAVSWGGLISVKLVADAVIPAPFDALRPVDLSEWTGVDDSEFERLVGYLRALVDHPVSNPPGLSLEGQWAVETPTGALGALHELMGRVGQLVEVFADDVEHTRQLRETLWEIGGTYRVVKEAIESFVAAGLGPNGLDGRAFAQLERGVLSQAIRNGRGHCVRIGARYFKVGGMREALTERAPAELVAMADETFTRLTQSDMDVFEAMDQLGDRLTTEARHVVRLLLAGQEQAARQRVAHAREVLLPLEDALDAAIESFQEIEASLGYAEPSATETESVHVSIQSIHIGGDVVNSNVVAASVIEQSAISVDASTALPVELKAALTELHKAVGALTAALPDDEAELAARDLKDLTEEVTSGSRRPAFWRRAADGLLSAAKKVADVGGPVIDLVTKVVILLG
jgi:hypothetical protein